MSPNSYQTKFVLNADLDVVRLSPILNTMPAERLQLVHSISDSRRSPCSDSVGNILNRNERHTPASPSGAVHNDRLLALVDHLQDSDTSVRHDREPMVRPLDVLIVDDITRRDLSVLVFNGQRSSGPVNKHLNLPLVRQFVPPDFQASIYRRNVFRTLEQT